MQPDEAPPPARRYTRIIGLLVVIGLLGCLCGGGWFVVRWFAGSADNAEPRDCLADDRGDSPPYRRVSCGDDAAKYRVLKVADRSPTGANPCVEVPGASRLFDTARGKRTVCIGDKDADPAKSANTARDGDCLRVARGGRGVDAERLDCADPRANFTVLRRLTDVYVSDLASAPGSPDRSPCSDVAGATTRYEYQWRAQNVKPRTPRLPGRHYDLMFCLGRIHEPPPAVPGDPTNCRFVTADAVLAAVNSVGGSHHSRAVRADSGVNSPCSYAVFRDDSGRDVVAVEFVGDFDWPPRDHEEFTVDGVKAAWRKDRLGLGDVYLAVQRPTGRFNVYVSFRGHPSSREVAIQVYRAAAPHVP